MRSLKRGFLFLLAGLALVAMVCALPFLTFQPGFTQELWATAPGFMGGMAFAPDGDLWVTPCVFSGGSLRRFDAQTTVVINGTTVHPLIATVPSVAGCGLTNHANRSLYSNTSLGVTRMDSATGAPIGLPFGPPGNALGIAVHPRTEELVYVGSNGVLHAVTPDFTAARVFSTVLSGLFVDGVFFDPQGNFLFTATRSGGFRVSILDGDTGALIQHVTIPSEPDGIAFHGLSPKFVLTVNTDGTMTALDFPADDFTRPPTVVPFASGGFRGDLVHVGPDGYLYLPQNGTRFDDGTTSSNNSVVRVGPGFSPTPGASPIALTPLENARQVGESLTLYAQIAVGFVPDVGRLVLFTVVNGPHAGLSGTGITDVYGNASFTYTGVGPGGDLVQASYVDDAGRTLVSNVSFAHWIQGDCFTLDFLTEDDFATPLVNGQHLDSEFGDLVTITSSGPNAGAAVFDSTPGGPNESGPDEDLLIDHGNLLVLQDGARASQSVPGFFDVPVPDPDGGDLVFVFPAPVEPRSVVLVDLDPPPNQGATVTLLDEASRTRVYTVPAGWTGTYGVPGFRTLDLTTLAPQVGNAPGFWLATASEMPGFLASDVVRIVVHMTGLGAMDDLAWCPPGSALARASARVRNGSGVNPAALANLTTPLLGGTWDVQLDCTGHASGLATLLVKSLPATAPTSIGELLVGGQRYLLRTRPHLGAAVSFPQPVPNELALAGFTACAQGMCTGGGARLSNALDLVLGL